MSTPRQRLFETLDSTTAASGLPSVVVADRSGLLIAAAGDAEQSDATAAITALRADGNDARGELVSGRVKTRSIDLGDDQVVVGALGDTQICGQVFDALESAVAEGLASNA